MKKFIALLLAAVLLAGCAPDGPTVTRTVETECRSTYYNPETGESYFYIHTYSYDRYGDLVLSVTYEDGKPYYSEKSVYDDRGNCILTVDRMYFMGICYPYYRTRYTYDEFNRCLSATYRNWLGIKEDETTYTYEDDFWDMDPEEYNFYSDDNGTPTRTEHYTGPDKTQLDYVYEFNEWGETSRYVDYTDGEPSTIDEYTYDENGSKTEYISRDANGMTLAHDTYAYEGNTVTSWDMEGNKTVETFRPDGNPERTEFYLPSGNLYYRNEYTYTTIQIQTREG
ncbi:MAG: hypothetical protein IKU31_02925 [Oscillospiraceae bacterium]|nr:hypothetical protein [Oscillospiraceae bacterium]